MAFKPSLRAHNKIQEIPLDIRPVMNLMVVLIPILLYSAEFVKLSIRELNLPPAASAENAAQQDDLKEKAKRFGLTILVSKEGFIIGNNAGYLTGEAEMQDGPTIPKVEDEYDYADLVQKLIDIREKIQGQSFVDEKSVIISAEADIPYKYIIKLIDNVTTYEDEDGTQKELFPQINIGQVI